MKILHSAILLLLCCGCEELLEKDISKDRITIIAPQQDASVQRGVIKFAWCNLRGAHSYHFMLVTPSFDNALQLVADTIVARDTTGRALYVNIELGEGEYQWKVTANNASYHSRSTIFNIRVSEPQNETGE